MKVELFDVEAKLGGQVGAIHITLFQSLDVAVERKSVFNAIYAHDDYICF